MSIASELVDKHKLFQEGLSTDFSKLRRCVVDFFGDNEDDIKRFQVKVYGDTSVYIISKTDGNRSHIFDVCVSEDRLKDITIRTESMTRTWKQDVVCNAIGYIPSNKNVRDWVMDIFEEIK